jgi:uncharacterized cupin superfamily protein
MTTVFRADDLNSSDFTESLLAPPMATPMSGDIVVRDRSYLADEKNGIYSGSWESEPGTSRWEFTTTGEVITVVSGSMTVEEDGGSPVKLTAGDTAYFPVGWKGVWTVHEKLRKIYVVYSA